MDTIENIHPRIILAKSAGFCFGVEKAVDAVFGLIKKGESVSTLGPIIHNTQVVSELERLGVTTLDTIDEATEGATIVIRSHGVEKDVLQEACALEMPVLDATCPFVLKIHKLVSKFSDDGYRVLIAGDKNHPEVIGIKSYSKEKAFIFSNLNELTEFFQAQFQLDLAQNEDYSDKKIDEPIILVAQTTFSVPEWNKCAEFANRLCTNIKIFDTICSATANRQKEAVEISQKCDFMVIVGGRHSSNTKKLYEVCSPFTETIHIETSEELYNSAFISKLHKDSVIGLTAGASTPSAIIKEVLSTMSEILNNNEEQNIEVTEVLEEATDNVSVEIEETAPEAAPAAVEEVAEKPLVEKSFDEMTFEEALEASLQSLSSDERVRGVVVGIAPNEVQVEVAGRKQAGYIPANELSFDPNVVAEDLVKIGDELELLIMRTNDQEGTIMLSKKRVDAARGWDIIHAAQESEEVLEGVVTDVIKGGILVSSNGVRVFIPASHVALRRMEDFTPLLKQKVRFKIIDTDQRRRRAVGSIRQVAWSERKDKEDEFWNGIEVGQEFVGAVKSLTNYGAFVDLGAADGMIHISELSWSRIKHPSDVVKVGQTVEVYIRDIDKEKKKISLGYRRTDENPWAIFKEKYPVDTVTEAKIVSITDFGAFAQIIPGIDGLIHISQIANRRIEKPGDELEVGQTVTVKIINVDYDSKRISLSIRALLPEEEKAEAVEASVSGEDEVVYSTDGTDVNDVAGIGEALEAEVAEEAAEIVEAVETPEADDAE